MVYLTGEKPFGGKVRDPFDDFSGPQNIGHLFISNEAKSYLLEITIIKE